MSPNLAIAAEKFVLSSPIAAAHPLTVLSRPEALDASGSRPADRVHISRNASSPVALHPRVGSAVLPVVQRIVLQNASLSIPSQAG